MSGSAGRAHWNLNQGFVDIHRKNELRRRTNKTLEVALDNHHRMETDT